MPQHVGVLPVLTGDPMSTSTSFVQGDTDCEALGELSDDELLLRAAREVLDIIQFAAER